MSFFTEAMSPALSFLRCPISTPGFFRDDRVFAVRAESVARIVHDRFIVVSAEVDAVMNVLIEIVAGYLQDLVELDGHELIAIFPALLVPEPDGVADLVNAVPGAAG